jgi:hypothetical protein
MRLSGGLSSQKTRRKFSSISLKENDDIMSMELEEIIALSQTKLNSDSYQLISAKIQKELKEGLRFGS